MAMTTTAPSTGASDGAAAPLYIDTQHEDLVHDVQMDFYGSKMATCSSGKSFFFFFFTPLLSTSYLACSALIEPIFVIVS